MWWALENHDRPLVCVNAYKPDSEPAYNLTPPSTLAQKWLDFDYVVKHARNNINYTYFAGEALPIFNPNLGPDIFGAILGCEIEFGSDTSWCNHPIDDIRDFKPAFDKDNIWWQRIKKLTEMAVEEAQGDFLIGMTDLHPGMDALVSLRGPENLCFDLFDYPEHVKALPVSLFDVFKEVYMRLESIISKNQQGITNWMNWWHPGRAYVTSCDFNVMLSKENFDDYVKPELILETEWLDANIYHLDGPGALHLLDSLLDIKAVTGIQWVPGAGAAPASEWGEVYNKCQEAGKMLHIYASPNELEALSKIVKPEGVCINVGWASSVKEADEIIELADSLWKQY